VALLQAGRALKVASWQLAPPAAVRRQLQPDLLVVTAAARVARLAVTVAGRTRPAPWHALQASGAWAGSGPSGPGRCRAVPAGAGRDGRWPPDLVAARRRRAPPNQDGPPAPSAPARRWLHRGPVAGRAGSLVAVAARHPNAPCSSWKKVTSASPPGSGRSPAGTTPGLRRAGRRLRHDAQVTPGSVRWQSGTVHRAFRSGRVRPAPVRWPVARTSGSAGPGRGGGSPAPVPGAGHRAWTRWEGHRSVAPGGVTKSSPPGHRSAGGR
jgi:hypothetical protein